MIHAAAARVVRVNGFNHVSVRGTFDTIERAYLIHWATGIEVPFALLAGLLLTLLTIIVVEVWK